MKNRGQVQHLNYRTQGLLNVTSNALQLFNAEHLPSEREAIKQTIFGTGMCKRSPLSLDEAKREEA